MVGNSVRQNTRELPAWTLLEILHRHHDGFVKKRNKYVISFLLKSF